jgi:hypothetical protein
MFTLFSLAHALLKTCSGVICFLNQSKTVIPNLLKPFNNKHKHDYQSIHLNHNH